MIIPAPPGTKVQVRNSPRHGRGPDRWLDVLAFDENGVPLVFPDRRWHNTGLVTPDCLMTPDGWGIWRWWLHGRR